MSDRPDAAEAVAAFKAALFEAIRPFTDPVLNWLSRTLERLSL